MVDEFNYESIQKKLLEQKLDKCKNMWTTLIKAYSLSVPRDFDPRNWYVEYQKSEEVLDTYICILRPISEIEKEAFESLFDLYLGLNVDRYIHRMISECRIYQDCDRSSELEEDNSLDNFLSEFVIK